MESIAHTLRSNGLKVTDARVALLAFLHTSPVPVDIADIKAHLAAENIAADETTIYRILNIFVDKGIVHQVRFQENRYRYEIADLPHHHHIICTQCGKIVDIEDCGVDELEDKVKKTLGFTVTAHRLELFGLCSSCRKTADGTSRLRS